MIIPIKQILLEAIQNNTKTITVYGESHFHRDEVDSIRQKVIKSKPDTLILELKEDIPYYKKLLPDTRIFHLEKDLDQNIYKQYKGDYKKQFEIREALMLKNIKTFTNQNSKNIVIVVGDTHLRTIQTPELSKTSPFYKYNFNIVRSKYKEIKW